MKRYNSYKNSDVAWVDEIPNHWDVKRGDAVFNLKKNLKKKDELSGLEVYHYSIPAIQEFGKPSVEEGSTIDSDKYIVEGGEILFSKLNPRKGTVVISAKHDKLAVASTEFVILEPVIGNITYYYYLLCSERFKYYISSLVESATKSHQRANPSDIYKSKFIIPPLFEQNAIAVYLDRKTTELDTLITNKKRLFELYEEEKVALINQAVIKGIDPKAKMKDSGIEWLGEIPEHWDVKRLRYLGFCQNGINKSAEFFGKGYPFLSYSDVYRNHEIPDELKGLVESDEIDRINYSVREGDTFFTRTSETIEEIGIASTCLKTIPDAVFAGFLIRFRPNTNQLIKEYSKYYFRAQIHRKYFVKEMNLVTRASLSQELLKKLPVLLPSIEEQRSIVRYIESECAIVNAKIAKTKRLIELLSEYRTALISEAVTGKIKVTD